MIILRGINLYNIIANSRSENDILGNTKNSLLQKLHFLYFIIFKNHAKTNQVQNSQMYVLTHLGKCARRLPMYERSKADLNHYHILNQRIYECHAQQRNISMKKNKRERDDNLKVFFHNQIRALTLLNEYWYKFHTFQTLHNITVRNCTNSAGKSNVLSTKLIPIIKQLRNYCTSCTDANSSNNVYHDECERAINEQILAELNAAYAYLSMACYFGRSAIALPGCYGFFIKMHEEEMGHAHKLIRYQNMRGGRVKLHPITCTNCTEWNIKKALEVSLEMEKLIKEKLVGVYAVGEKHLDLNLMDMIVTEFISEQEKSICEFSRLLTRFNSICGCGNCGCSEFLFDKHMHSAFVKNTSNADIYSIDERYK